MQKITHQLKNRLSFLSACSVCGALSLGEFLCEFCLKRWRQETKQQMRFEGKGIKHYYFKTWHEIKGSDTKKIIESQKQGCRSPHQYLNLLLPSVLSLSEKLKDLDAIIVPCPSKVAGQEDHAFRIAQVLSQILNYKMENCLIQPKSDLSQKEKTKEDRENRRYFLSYKPMEKQIIFVDDVLTTGSSFRAAQRALGPDKNYTVFTIFYRPLLRSKLTGENN